MNTKTLLGLGAIGGAIYLATSKKAQAKVKKTTGLSDKSYGPMTGGTWAENYIKDSNPYKKLNWYIMMGSGREKTLKGIKYIIFKDQSVLKWNPKSDDGWELSKKTTGLSDVGKDPAKITKLREIVKEKQYKRISGSIVDMNTANIILQFYDNLTPENKKSYAKKSIQEMSRIAWSKAKTGLSDSGKKAQAKEKVKKYLLKWGNNENEVNKMVNRSFEDAYNMYSPPLSPMKLAEIVIRIDGVIGVER